jgi:hypothetical protein
MHAIGAMDRAFLSMPADQPPVVGFFLDFLGPPPSYDDLAARVLREARRLPALLHVFPPRGARTWPTRTGDLDQKVHLRHREIPAGGTQALVDACDDLIGQPLPGPEHPQWDCWLLTQPEAPDRFRVCFRVHHAFLDGVGAAHALIALLADSPVGGPRLHGTPRLGPGAVLRAAWSVASPAVRTDRARQHLGSAPPDRAAPLWSHHDVPTARLHALATAHGVTVNDVSLAALALALRSWRASTRPSATQSPPPPDQRTVLIMSTRRIHEQYAPGNYVAGSQLGLPRTATTLGAALQAVHRQTQVLRRTQRRHAVRALLDLPRPLGPSPGLLRGMLGPRVFPLLTSSVTFPVAFTSFGARLDAASMVLTVGAKTPVYLSFTRTPDTVRCTVVADAPRAHAVDLSRHWADALAPA